jgi:hypothetical protein
MRTPTVVDPRDDHVGRKWTRYRLIRAAFWLVILLTGAIRLEIYLPLFIGVMLVALFWPCPRCGKRVGILSIFRVFHLPWPFGGVCMSCFKPLLARPKDA